MTRAKRCLLALLAAPIVCTPAFGQTAYELGMRASVLTGDGQLGNGVSGAGLIGRLYLTEGWFAAATLDYYAYDFERPYEVAGLAQDSSIKSVDSTITSTTFGASIGRNYRDRNAFDWFWSAGVGVGFPDSSDVSGPTNNGGMFDLAIDAKTEIQMMGMLGMQFYLTDRWSLTVAGRAEHHFIDVRVVDRVTGATGKIASQTPLGVQISLNTAF